MTLDREDGLSLIEVLLVIVIIGVIAAVGIFVYSTQHAANKSLDQALNTSPAVAWRPKTSAYLKLKTLGIQIPVNKALKNLTVGQVAQSDGSTVTFTTPAFVQAVQACRIPANAKSTSVIFATMDYYSGQYDPKHPPIVYAKLSQQFRNFYVVYSNPDGGFCDGSDQAKNQTVQQLFKQLDDNLQAALKQAKPLQ